MSRVRTVCGDVDASALGRVDAHDHLLIVGGPAVRADPDLRLDDRADAEAELAAFRDAGGGTVLDAMPSGCGRDPRALRELSERTGVHVVATAGLHKAEYYDDLHWARRYDVDDLTAVLLAECLSGFDEHDGAGPVVRRMDIRPGVLKVATGYNAIRPAERRAIEAVARVSARTGLPVITHADHGTLGLEQLDLLEEHGVPAHAVAIGHMDRNPDPALHLEIASRGAFLSYDGLARERYRPVSAVAAIVMRLAEAGHGGRIVLGGDIARRSLRRSAGAPGLAGVLTHFAAQLRRAGVDDATLDDLLVANPARMLALRAPTYPPDELRSLDALVALPHLD